MQFALPWQAALRVNDFMDSTVTCRLLHIAFLILYGFGALKLNSPL